MRNILRGTEYMTLHDDGCISRPAIGMGPSGQWRLTGAVERNNFGHVVKHYSLDDVLRAPEAIPWKHKDGKQRTCVTDFDHGTHREWCSPAHHVF